MTAPAHYPVALDLRGRPCLVVGGGAVAEMKVHALVAAGARVTLVSPALTPGLAALVTAGRCGTRPDRIARAMSKARHWRSPRRTIARSPATSRRTLAATASG